MSDHEVRKILQTSKVVTDANRRVIEGDPDWDDEAFLLAGVLVERYSGLSVGHIKAIVDRAMNIIVSRALVSPATVILPELGEEYRAVPDG